MEGQVEATHTPPLPYNLEAERSVLGAILIHRDAIISVAPWLSPEDFYREAHAWIYEAQLACYQRREPPDLVTVAAELERRGRLEAVGGVLYLNALVDSVPTPVHVEYYGRIVERCAVLRRLIAAGGQIAAIGYEAPEDVDEALSRAEELIFAISQRRVTRDFVPIREVTSEYFDHLSRLRATHSGVIGVPTGFHDLDRILGGLQRSDLIVLAARPTAGKTSLALSVALNVAHQGIPVGIFSLEMSREQLVQRFLAMETEIDSHRLRQGFLSDEEFQQVSEAMGRLSETPIFIDDTPGIPITELRSKARRLHAEQEVELLVVDYLQLIQGRRTENRVQEISEISRALKGLARELDVPVLAISQLSRSVEHRTPHIPMLADLRESGCLAGDTLIMRADTGMLTPIREIAVQGEPVPVLALDEHYRLRRAVMRKAWRTGTMPVYQLRTRTGRTIRASGNHPFRKLQGWCRLDRLRVGDRIAVPLCIPDGYQAVDIDSDRIVLLAHLIGDGSYLAHHILQYTSSDPACLSMVEHCATRAFPVRPRRVQQGNCFHLYLSANRHLTHKVHNPIAEWLQELGIFDQRSSEKTIPAPVFRLSTDQIALFLRHLWATNGSISRAGPRRYVLFYASTSRTLVAQLQHLLLRLGIISTIRINSKPGYRPTFQLHIQGCEMQRRFLDRVGIFGGKSRLAEEALCTLEGVVANPNFGVIPREAWAEVERARRERAWSLRTFHRHMGWAHNGTGRHKSGISRQRMRQIAELMPDPVLEALATSDIYWDEVVEITPCGTEEVFDAEVPGLYNFVANDIVVKNSIEQDADVVMFIYREDMYDPDTDKKGIAEIHIAKHRNGPTGKAYLRFFEQTTRFASLERYREEEGYP